VNTAGKMATHPDERAPGLGDDDRRDYDRPAERAAGGNEQKPGGQAGPGPTA
jgi:hypothetical protein